ncbi:response regulator [Desulfococcaceae bacterium HSG7]|nr:response regulator [Desulfococcaceae bacterium HSG7]
MTDEMIVKRKILIVDDEPDMRIFMSVLFETNGFKPTLANNGKDGLHHARKLHPDLIILDVMMPEEGGALMYKGLKEDARLRQIPVIMLSGVKEDVFLHYLKMLNIGAKDTLPKPDAYFEKPPEPDLLLNKAQTILER